MPWSNIATYVLSIIAGLGIGGWVGVLIESRQVNKRDSRLRTLQWRENQYKKLLVNSLSFFDGWSQDKDDKTKKREFMETLYSEAFLFASDDVVKLANQFVRGFNKNDENKNTNTDEIHRQLVLAIRKEMKKLNGEKTKLTEEDIRIFKLD